MIVVELSGGLGNQMFQYAFGKSLSRRHNTVLKMDVSFFEKQDLRKFELGVFPIKQKFITKKESDNYFVPDTILKKIRKKLFGYKKIVEKGFEFFPAALGSTRNTCISGYWQSEKYFLDFEKEIRDSFRFIIPPDSENEKFINQIQNKNSVSVHIRRGDYVLDPKTNMVHGTCDLGYYQKAINYISKKIPSPVFYIFSDDLTWAKENIQMPFEHYFIDHNINDYEDLRLMSNCKHNIIANSSFSWWAAWLNENKNKIVIAPEKWFNDIKKNTKDLIPESWTKL